MARMSSLLALCAAIAVCSSAQAVETLQQVDAEVVREVVEASAGEPAPAVQAEAEPVVEGASASVIASTGLESGEATAPATGQARSASPATLQRPGARWNAFLPGMVR